MSLATDMLESYIAAEKAVLKGLAYRTSDGRQLTRANLPEIIAGRREWERRVASETSVAGGREGGYAVADFGGCR
jgi:hypothetical protein